MLATTRQIISTLPRQVRLSPHSLLYPRIQVNIHTTSTTRALPVPLIIKTVLKPIAAFSGRYMRRWWQRLPEEKRSEIKRRFFKSRRVFASVGGTGFGFGLIYYVLHLETTPITGRRRYMSIDDATMESVIQSSLEELVTTMAPTCLQTNHHYHRRVNNLLHRLCKCNSDFETMKQEWNLLVIPNDEIINAICLPNGIILVFTGLLKFVENDDQLAYILAHELSHVLLQHGREMVSYGSFIDWVAIPLVMLVWTIFPFDILAVIGHWLHTKFLDIFLQLPYNRKIEKEADAVGLEMTAKACFDIREAVKFWELMDVYEKGNGAPPVWLSTHPKSLDRAKDMSSAMGQMLEVRRECGCYELKDRLLNIFPRTVLFPRTLNIPKSF